MLDEKQRLVEKFTNLYNDKQKEFDELVEKVKNEREQLCADTQKISKIRSEAQKRLKNANEYSKKIISRIDEYITGKCKMYPHLAGLSADLITLHYEKSAQLLETKTHPAYSEAARIRELRQETKGYIAKSKELEYKLEYIKALFPNIEEIFEEGFNKDEPFELETEETTDRVRHFLSAEEYAQLSVSARNQLALDRYLQRSKTRWQIGRDYEMYVGYLYEKEGYAITYNGILENLQDMGRDLIAAKDDTVLIIQCKNWSKEKEIHEKHVFQLFGSLIQYNIEHPSLFPAKAVFISSTKLSSMAKKVAKQLDIEIRLIDMGEFPRIKCNINRTTGERIYHLPFDQQYDKTVIDERVGEMYAFSVSEAEEHGFRRAQRHFQNG